MLLNSYVFAEYIDLIKYDFLKNHTDAEQLHRFFYFVEFFSVI